MAVRTLLSVAMAVSAFATTSSTIAFGTRIAPGDYLVADRDGAIRVPKAIVEDVVAKAETAIATVSKVRTAILAGTDPQEAYRQFGKF